MVKNWRRNVSLVSMIVIGTTGLLEGCGTTSKTSSSSGGSSSGVVQLTYWNMWSGNWENVIQKLVNEFNATHPNIHVNVLSVPAASGDQKLLTAIAAGDPPDVFTEWNPVIGEFASKKALMNLNQFMTGKYSGLKNWFYPQATQFGTYNGNMYAMPWMMNTFALFYNKTIMKNAGLNPNSPPQTLAQLWTDQAKEWRFGSGGVVKQIGFYPNNNFEYLMPAFGLTASDLYSTGQYTLLNSKSEADMGWISKYKKYPYNQVSAFESGLNSAGGGSVDAFDLGKAGFWISGMWEMGQVQMDNPNMDYGVEPIPSAPGGNNNATWINGGYNEIPVGSKHPEQAFEFISWLSGYDNETWAAQAYPQGGWIPPSPKVTQEPAYQKWLNQDPQRKMLVSILSNSSDTSSPVTPASMMYEADLTNAEEYVLQGKKSVEQALSDVQNNVNQELNSPQ